MLRTCYAVKKSLLSALTVLFFILLTVLEASSKPHPSYFRYELLKLPALTNLVVGDFNGDGRMDIAGLTLSRRTLVAVPANREKFAFGVHYSFRLPVRAQSLFAVNIADAKHTNLALLARSPSRLQIWQISGRAGKFSPRRQVEILLPDSTEQLYIPQHSPANKLVFFARTEAGMLNTLTLQTKTFPMREVSLKETPILLSHRVSDVILPYRSSSSFFTRAVGENVLWFHRPPPASPLAIHCKESVSLAATHDFNNNGLLDLVTVQALANGKTDIEVMYDVGVETGISPIRFESSLNPKQIFIRDFNGDGLLDIGLSDGLCFALHFAKSPTIFSPSVLIAFSDVASGITVADLNQDGRIEIIVSEQKTGKLVVYSASHYEHFGVERLATSGEPEQITFHSPQKQILVASNRHHLLEQIQIKHQPLHVGSISTNGKVVALWQDDVETVWLSSSPSTLVRKPHKSGQIVSHHLSLLDISRAFVWQAINNQPPILVILEKKVAGAVPQLLFYALNRDSALSISEMLLSTPISAETIIAIGGTTLKHKHYLVLLKIDKTVPTVIVYELKVQNMYLHLVETGRYVLPKQIPLDNTVHLLVRANQDKMDFLVASSKHAVLLLAEQLYQPQQISNFPKLSPSDVILWSDGNGDKLADLFISCHRRAEVLFLRGRPKGKFDSPKSILDNVIATAITSAVTRHRATLFVANAKLHTIDMLHLRQ